MPIVAIVGGSRKETVKLVKESQKVHSERLRFKVFDYKENCDEAGVWEYNQCKDEADMVFQAVKNVADQKADILLKGDVKTHTLLKEVLKKEHQLKEKEVLSHVAMINLPNVDRPLLLTDSGMSIDPDENQLIAIIDNAIGISHKIGIKRPKVALLSAAENINPKMPSSVLAQAVTKKSKKNKKAIIYGPLSLDLALSEKAVNKKQFDGPIKGDADILVVPTIDSGNILYKSLLLFSEATMGGTIVGTKIPIVLTSRSDELKSKLAALKFAVMQLNERK